ncbi:MAG: hypothetical protein ACKVP0_01095 [Pirellulaceae bacterium]
MAHQWLCSLIALVLVLPHLFGCGSSGGTSGGSGSGLTPAELEKMMADEKGATAMAPGPEVTAEKLLESLMAEPSTSGSAKKAVAERKQIVTGTVLDRSPKEAESGYLTLDGGTHNGKPCKLKFQFAINAFEDVADVKVGDKTRIMGSTDGEIKEDTLEFKECYYRPVMTPLTPQPPNPPEIKK